MTEIETLEIASLIEKYLSLQKADQYYELLMEQNRAVNLVSRETTREDFDRMVAESLLPIEHLPGSIDNYIDIGSGGGFPSIPLLLSGRLSGKAVLIERTGKKAKALDAIVSQLGLTADVVPGSFEEQANLPQADLVTLRWVKLSRQLMGRIMTRLSPQGSLVYYSTPDLESEKLSITTRQFVCPQSSAIKSFAIIKKSADR